MCVCVCMRACVWMCVCMHACVCVYKWMCVWMCGCECMPIHVHVFVDGRYHVDTDDTYMYT